MHRGRRRFGVWCSCRDGLSHGRAGGFSAGAQLSRLEMHDGAVALVLVMKCVHGLLPGYGYRWFRPMAGVQGSRRASRDGWTTGGGAASGGRCRPQQWRSHNQIRVLVLV